MQSNAVRRAAAIDARDRAKVLREAINVVVGSLLALEDELFTAGTAAVDANPERFTREAVEVSELVNQLRGATKGVTLAEQLLDSAQDRLRG